MRSDRLPVTVIYGLPGSGKTALIGSLLGRRHKQRIALRRLYGATAALDHVYRLAVSEEVDYLLLEAAGCWQPESLAACLTKKGGLSVGLAELVRLDTMVAVVDVSCVLDDFCSSDLLSDRGLVAHRADDRALAEALAEQLEFADVVLLNKADRASSSLRRAAGLLVRALNPEAELIETQFGHMAPQKVLATHTFDLVRAQNRARWVKTLSGDHSSTRAASGISSFLYHSRRPFHPGRLLHFMRSTWPGVIRCRGFLWLATRMDSIGELSQAGTSRRYRAAGSWWAAIMGGRELDGQFFEGVVGIPWDARFGDRCQQLAFVGIGMHEADLRTRLNECLLDDREFAQGPEGWQAYPDRFPPWEAQSGGYRTAH